VARQEVKPPPLTVKDVAQMSVDRGIGKNTPEGGSKVNLRKTRGTLVFRVSNGRKVNVEIFQAGDRTKLKDQKNMEKGRVLRSKCNVGE